MEQKGVFSMGNTSEDNKKKHICLGLVAHVDAGKTTLSEGMLYLTGGIRSMGRVDHGDAFLDTYELERERGITIFSKQARRVRPKHQRHLLGAALQTAALRAISPLL